MSGRRQQRRTQRHAPTFEVWSRVVAFALGVFGFVWQVVVEQTDRPFLIGAIMVLLGLPLAQTIDRLRTSSERYVQPEERHQHPDEEEAK